MLELSHVYGVDLLDFMKKYGKLQKMLCSTESNPSVARYEEHTKKLRSILCTTILSLFGSVFGAKVEEIQICYVFCKSGGDSVSLRVFLLRTYVFTTVRRTHLRIKQSWAPPLQVAVFRYSLLSE
jgi:hypothetical protein